MNYYQQLKYLIMNPTENRWDYYKCHERETVESIFEYPSQFIELTFLHAKKDILKSSVADGKYRFNVQKISSSRAAHSISSLFLGFILSDGLMRGNLNQFCSFENTKIKYPFTYVWNLTSLYHDFGYQYEQDNSLRERIVTKLGNASQGSMRCKYVSIDSLKKELDVKHSIWTPSFYYRKRYTPNRLHNDGRLVETMGELSDKNAIEKYICDNSKYFRCNGRKVRIPSITSSKTSKYLHYRLCGCPYSQCVDHGIAGGVVFYDLIIKNYLHEFSKKKAYCRNVNIHEFTIRSILDKDLRFGIDQTILFSYIADCIIKHNIWKADGDTEEIYRHYGLDDLIGDAYEKINFHKNPLLFILCMSDTLEPYKNFHRNVLGSSMGDVEYQKDNVKQIFEKYSIAVDEDRIVVTVPQDWIDSFKEKLNGMTKWLDIRYTDIGQEFVIEIL